MIDTAAFQASLKSGGYGDIGTSKGPANKVTTPHAHDFHVRALVLSLAVIGGIVQVLRILWKQHTDADERDRQRLAATESRLEVALAGNRELADVTGRAVAVAEGALDSLRRDR